MMLRNSSDLRTMLAAASNSEELFVAGLHCPDQVVAHAFQLLRHSSY